ncbi:MAG: Arabinose 5-phosphate isomerase KdsD [Verrucomicrobia subdivision 3 bacterium]|nr:Arabinose 5-phosphate isomerase KdsD [Limisphaerales bacterium]MCS1413217.1 Arabinose 5-phosphate isomerase KdsD [Limisphaerales bacterium]
MAALSGMSYLREARRVIDIEIAGLEAVRSQLNASFERAVDLVVRTVESRGKVVVAGVGKSGNIGRKIAATLTSTGTTSVFLDSVDALHGDLGILNDGDLVILLSYSGESEELLQLLLAIKRFDVRVIAFTGKTKSTMARASDIVLNVAVPAEACPFNLAPTASTTATLAMGDALAMAVLKARGFEKEDFARNHPSGLIGRALLLRVGDIMRSGARNPTVKQMATVKDALFVMSEAKSGCVSVTDGRGRLVGVFTDGDLRRLMTDSEKSLHLRLREVMTRDPIRIEGSALAVEALRLFDTKSIDDLIVVNAKGEPVGLVDSQDLPKMKLM